MAFCPFLATHRGQASISVRGAEDNAHMESFFHSRKAELTRGMPLVADRQRRSMLDADMRYDNARRAHSALAYQSPIAFERDAA